MTDRTAPGGSGGIDVEGRSGLRILSLSCVYPNPGDAVLGVFVRSRLMHLNRLAEVKVLAPIARIDYAKSDGRRLGRGGIPLQRWDEGHGGLSSRLDLSSGRLCPQPDTSVLALMAW